MLPISMPLRSISKVHDFIIRQEAAFPIGSAIANPPFDVYMLLVTVGVDRAIPDVTSAPAFHHRRRRFRGPEGSASVSFNGLKTWQHELTSRNPRRYGSVPWPYLYISAVYMYDHMPGHPVDSRPHIAGPVILERLQNSSDFGFQDLPLELPCMLGVLLLMINILHEPLCTTYCTITSRKVYQFRYMRSCRCSIISSRSRRISSISSSLYGPPASGGSEVGVLLGRASNVPKGARAPQ